MSATRLASRKARAISQGLRVLLAAHGSLRQPSAQASVLAQASALEAATGAVVRAGFLRVAPKLAQAAGELGDGPFVVLPMFMADGYLVRRALPRALGCEARILTPFGLVPRLAELIAAEAIDACTAAGLVPERATLLLIGHGSARGPASRHATETQAQRIAALSRFAGVAVAFLEESPTIEEQCRRCRGDLVACGFFAAPGGHADQDVPRRLADDPWGRERRVLYTGAIGTHADAVRLLAEILEVAA